MSVLAMSWASSAGGMSGVSGAKLSSAVTPLLCTRTRLSSLGIRCPFSPRLVAFLTAIGGSLAHARPRVPRQHRHDRAAGLHLPAHTLTALLGRERLDDQSHRTGAGYGLAARTLTLHGAELRGEEPANHEGLLEHGYGLPVARAPREAWNACTSREKPRTEFEAIRPKRANVAAEDMSVPPCRASAAPRPAIPAARA